MYLDRKDRTLITPDQKRLVEARWELQKSGVPKLFGRISDLYVGCSVVSQAGDWENDKWPSVSLTGPRTSWAPIIGGKPELMFSESAEIGVEMRGLDPYISILKQYKARRGNKIEHGGARQYKLNSAQIRCPSLSLVEFVAKQIEMAKLLNPGEIEIDYSLLRKEVGKLALKQVFE